MWIAFLVNVDAIISPAVGSVGKGHTCTFMELLNKVDREQPASAFIAIDGEAIKTKDGPMRFWTKGGGIAAASLMITSSA